MNDIVDYLPMRVNTGPFLVAYTLAELERRVGSENIVLPICSLGTPVEQLRQLAPLVLPPIYHEALGPQLKSEILHRIEQCFPYYMGTHQREEFRGNFGIVELPQERHEKLPTARVLGFSVDTAVEEHGPHLPLSTDTIQSYSVLNRLAKEIDGFVIGPPVEYGQLTWGLPFGLSIDITAPLLTRYVTGFVNAICDWCSPDAIYVVDVHGSLVHRGAIQEGLARSRCDRFAFRWLHEPLVEFAGDRGDQHAGGVETALVHSINEQLVDDCWWPDRIVDLARGQMRLEEAFELSADLDRFIQRAKEGSFNGIVGDITNFDRVDAVVMMERMLATARSDVQALTDALE